MGNTIQANIHVIGFSGGERVTCRKNWGEKENFLSLMKTNSQRQVAHQNPSTMNRHTMVNNINLTSHSNNSVHLI